MVAKVVATKHSFLPGDPAGNHLIEDASFVVTEVFRGKYKVGELVRVCSMIGVGLCGRSARNDPPWLEEVSKPPEDSGHAITSVAIFPTIGLFTDTARSRMSSPAVRGHPPWICAADRMPSAFVRALCS